MNTQYLQQENGTIRFSGPLKKLKTLPAGIYDANVDQFGDIYLNTVDTHTDELITLPGSPAEQINADVDSFLSAEVRHKFERYNLLYKRGLLMHGIPGTGKTSIVHLLMRQAIKKNMVVLLNPRPHLVESVADTVRSIEKVDRPFMVVWEEFERWVESEEGNLLDLLDGVDQVDNVFFLATTNYLEQIPSRIRNRPSRFSDIIEIGAPDAPLRRAYLEAKIHDDDEVNMDEWVEKTAGLTIDHLKDVVISVLALDVSLDNAIAKIKRMEQEDMEYGGNSIKSKSMLRKLLRDANKLQEKAEAVDYPQPMQDTGECASVPLGG